MSDGVTWVAVYGAVVASASLLWQVWRARRDRGRLRLTLHPVVGLLVAPGREPIETGHALAFDITNTGARPTYLAGIGVRLVDGGHGQLMFHKPGELPRRLEPEESVRLTGTSFSALEPTVRTVYAFDSVGRHYACSAKVLARARATYAKRKT